MRKCPHKETRQGSGHDYGPGLAKPAFVVARTGMGAGEDEVGDAEAEETDNGA